MRVVTSSRTGTDGLDLDAWIATACALPAPSRRPGGEVEPYTRTTLHRDEQKEVLLLHWQDGLRSAPHDHGPASGIVVLLRGSFTERLWRKAGRGVQLSSSRHYQAPARLPIERRDIHDMLAEGGGVRLHIYTPSIRGMRVFDVAGRRTLVVDDTCGAWIPSQDHLVLSRQDW